VARCDDQTSSTPPEIERVDQTGCIADAGSRAIAVEASYRTTEAALKAELEKLQP